MGLGLTLTAFIPGAQAQDKPPETSSGQQQLQEVVVTGSRIARPDLDRLQPTTVVDTDTFDKRGYADIAQALQDLPAFGVQSASAANQQGGLGGVGQAFVDLYSLGSQRTLTLVNGRRFVSSNSSSFIDGASAPGQQVDLNVIPVQLIERVETISVGGAPIYGADAISGTVNIILKKNFQGLALDAQAGVSNQGDAWNYRFSALGGRNFFDDRGNVTAVAEVVKSDGLVGTSRKDYASDLQFLAPLHPGPFARVLTPNTHVGPINTSGIPLLDDTFLDPAKPAQTPAQIGVTNGAGQTLAFAPGSSALTPYNLGQETGNPVFWQGGDGARLSQFSNLLAPQVRVNFDTLGNFKLTDHVSLVTEGWFSDTHAHALVAQPAYSSALFSGVGTPAGNLRISVNNPFLSAADRATLAAELQNYGANTTPQTRQDPNWDAQHFYLARASDDLQNGSQSSTQVVARGVVGLTGDFSVFDRNYNWDTALSYGASRDESSTAQVILQNLYNAVDATTDASGHIVCAGNPVSAPVSTTGQAACTPLNIFGQGSPSAAARGYVVHDALAESFDTQRDFTINLNGDVMKLPAGEWRAAVGFENRRESATFTPDSFYSGGYGPNTVLPVEGAYRTNEIYAETLIPIIEPAQDLPALHQVELEGAVRRVSNSIAGTATTWTGGLRWSPIEDIQFRANKTKSIRAPAITELFLPPSTSFEFANDPCDKNYVTQGTAPARRAANCAAAGINAATFESNVVNASGQGLTSGNARLTSEVADSKTFGVVLRPHWVPQLSLAIDYIEINLTNAIEQLNLVEILDACYDAANYPNNASCSAFTRNSAGQITSFHDGFVNAGVLDFQGISASLNWSAALPGSLGRINTRVNYLDTRKLLQVIGSASPQNLAGESGGANPNIAVPKGKATLDIEYRKGSFSWDWQGQYYSGLNFDNTNTASSQDVLRVNPWWLIDSTLSYDVTSSFTTRLVVNNVFDKQPPYPALAGTGGNFASAASLYFPGVIGRTYLMSFSYRF